MCNILTRLKEFIDFKGIPIASFEKSIGMSNASFGKQLKRGAAIGSDKLENILRVYPDLSPLWLMTGHGNMILEDISSSDVKDKLHFQTIASHHDETPFIDRLIDLISERDAMIRTQAEEIGRLKERIEQLELNKKQTIPEITIPRGKHIIKIPSNLA